ncbi:MAG: hypothetical protein M1482_16490 [Chloroflexi bacterium]|nr:hypothetical protein [Chloroflexota bacterium]
MTHRVLFVAVLVACAVLLLGCASTAVAPTPTAPANQANVAAPSVSKGPLSLPPQPTFPPIPTRAALVWQTAVPALIVSGPTLVPTNTPTPAPTGAAPTKAAATAQATATPSAPAVPTAPGVATGKQSQAKFEFDPALTTIELADPLDAAMKQVPGIIECSSSQTSAVVTYDAGLITVQQIMQAFAQQGYPVKPE